MKQEPDQKPEITPEEADKAIGELFDFARHHIAPQLTASRFCIATAGNCASDVDLPLCLQIGMALMLEKPLIILIDKGAWLPPRARQLADAVVEGPVSDPAAREQMKAAILRLVGRREPT